MSPLRVVAYLSIAALALGFGINEVTGLTGKDEYLLGLRIPMEMMQGDHWWVPFIDGEPRIKKPPFLYWLGRASFESFGPSLVAARGITVAFALLLLGSTAWLGRQLAGNWRTGLMAAAVLLGMSGIESESRRFMLDIPVAALSMAAFCCYLSWSERPRWLPLLGVAALLSAALLTKGPVALICFGGGVLALWVTRPQALAALRRHWFVHLALPIVVVALPALWYVDVRDHYAVQLARAAEDELEARRIGLTADALIGIVALALPWSFVAVQYLWSRRWDRQVRFLTDWLLITLLPFLFVRSFDRYLIGSLPALALLAALSLEQGKVPAWCRRLGSLLPALIAIALILLLWRWQLGGWVIFSIALLGFVIAWWRRTPTPIGLTASAVLLWSTGWALAFPALGVNDVPQTVLDLTRDKPVILFSGPQPALLPILEKRPLHQTSQLPASLAAGTLIALRVEDRPALDAQLATLGREVTSRLEYQSLTSAGSGIRFAREGATREDWHQAWIDRSPAPLLSTVQIVEVAP